MYKYKNTITFYLSIFLSFSAMAFDDFDDFDEFFGPEPPPSANVDHFTVVLVIFCLMFAYNRLKISTKKIPTS
jgi:hypothetical protein